MYSDRIRRSGGKNIPATTTASNSSDKLVPF
jgi:hypothetical protein